MERLLRAQEVAEILDVDRFRVYESARHGVLPHVRMGRQVRFDPQVLRAWIEAGGAAAAEQEQ